MCFATVKEAISYANNLKEWKECPTHGPGTRHHPVTYHPVKRYMGQDEKGIYTILACAFIKCDFEVPESKRYEVKE